MADNYHLVETSGQMVSGSDINETFEIKPSTSKLTNLQISTGGGNDTIKITDSSYVGIDATINGFNSNCVIDFSEAFYGNLIYKVKSDGILLTDTNQKLSLKFAGYTDSVSFETVLSGLNNYYLYATTKFSTADGGQINGTSYDDEIFVNHSQNYVYADRGNDTVIARTDNNTVYAGYGDDAVILHGNNNILYGNFGNDILISNGDNNHLYDTNDKNGFISGGNAATITGSNAADTIAIYSYKSDGVQVTATGGGNNDFYVLSTGLVSITGDNVLTTNYNSSYNDTLNVTITDFDSLDSIYIRDKNMTGLTHNITSEGIYIRDNTGRVNIFLPNQNDWDAIKGAQFSYDDMNANVGTLTLEQAENLPIIYPPTGITVDGYNATVTSEFNGELWMVDGYAGTNYNNQNIRDIDATPNSNTLLIAGNSQSNYIKAGSGTTSLWGGAGSVADTLQGGGGQTMFWYGKGDGIDVISNAHDYDTINLYDVTLNDVTDFGVANNDFSIAFNTGNVLKVYDSGATTPTMQLADGSRYVFNRTTGSWT